MIILPQISTKLVSACCVLILYFLIDWQSSCLLFKKKKATSAWKRKLQFHGQLACIVFSQDFLKLQLYVTDIGNSKKTVSLIEIILGPLISAVTGVCNKKVSISTGFPRSGYVNY